jgi:hypothetical protein
MIEKYKTYVPVAEKIALVKKISPIVVDDMGIINKNDLKIASTCFFVGAYVQDKEFTTNDYDYIKQNKLDFELRGKLEKDEIHEWETILDNEINLIAMQRKTQNTNVMSAIVSLLNSLQGKLKSTNFEKAIKEVNKIIDNPERLGKFKELQNIADTLK